MISSSANYFFPTIQSNQLSGDDGYSTDLFSRELMDDYHGYSSTSSDNQYSLYQWNTKYESKESIFFPFDTNMLTLSDPGESHSPCENDFNLAPTKPVHTVKKAVSEKYDLSLNLN